MATSEPMLEVDRSESFTNGLLHNLWDMKTHGKLTDLTIILANVLIPCHSVVMAAASKHVRVLLEGPMREDTNKEIELNFDEMYVQRVVDYCYTGKITIELSAVKPYLRIAEYFHLIDLKSQIEEFVCEHVSPKTCRGWYSLATEFSLSTLEEKSKVLRASTFKEMTENTEFFRLPLRELTDYIKLVDDADVVLEACVNWMTSNALSRSEEFLDLLNHIQLDQCSPQCIERVLQTWKPTWPNYSVVQEALRPRALAVPRGPARQRKLTVMLLGGYTPTNALNRRWWNIDLTAGSCELFATMDHRAVKYNAGYCSTTEKLFVIGGSKALRADKRKLLSDCHALCVQDSKCEVWPDMEVPIAHTVAICVNDHIYTFAGETTMKSVYRLNMKTKIWTKCADMPVGNACPIIATVKYTVYMIFNTIAYNQQFKTSNKVIMCCFDTSNGKWTFLKALPASIHDTCRAKAVSVGEDIYLVGGRGKLCARYSPQHKTWTMLESPQLVHQWFSAVYMDGEIILCGGCDENEKTHNIIQVYSIAQNSWIVHSVRMPVALKFHHCAVYDEVARKIVM